MFILYTNNAYLPTVNIILMCYLSFIADLALSYKNSNRIRLILLGIVTSTLVTLAHVRTGWESIFIFLYI